MKKDKSKFNDLLEKYIIGDITVEEKILFAETLKSSKENQIKFEEYSKISSILENLSQQDFHPELLGGDLIVSQFEKKYFQKKFKKIKHTKDKRSIILKIAAAIILVGGMYQSLNYLLLDKFNLFHQNTKYVLREFNGRCYSNGVLLKKGDTFENSLIQSGKKSTCLIEIAKENADFSLQILPETELVNLQNDNIDLWKLNQGKVLTKSLPLAVQLRIKDHSINMENGSAFMEFEKGRLNVEVLKGKIYITQNSAYLFGSGTKKIISKNHVKILEEKFPNFFGDLKSEIEEGTSYTLKYDLEKLNQKELILSEIETMISFEKNEISQNSLVHLNSFLNISGPKIQSSLSYLAEADFPFLTKSREDQILKEAVALLPTVKGLEDTKELNEFAMEEEEYYKHARESLDKKPVLIFTLNLKDSTSLIGELSQRNGFFIIKTSEGKELEIPKEQVALIELK